jgi:hypothetical protein
MPTLTCASSRSAVSAITSAAGTVASLERDDVVVVVVVTGVTNVADDARVTLADDDIAAATDADNASDVNELASFVDVDDVLCVALDCVTAVAGTVLATSNAGGGASGGGRLRGDNDAYRASPSSSSSSLSKRSSSNSSSEKRVSVAGRRSLPVHAQ